MKAARIIGGSIALYPYLLRPDAKRAHPEVSPLPGSWEQCSPEQRAALEMVEVLEVAQPTLEPGESLSEGVPDLVAGDWRQTWVVTPAPPDETIRAGLVATIKQMAREHILVVLPEWKQANATARGLELTRIGMTRALTEPEQAELAGLEYAWAWVKSVRVQSDVAEAALAGMTRAELNAWTEPSWPAWGA